MPVRVPDTICVQERLPPGAAAVLINRAHTDTDIYLPIDAREKRLVDAIDGERSIGEIAGDEQRDVCRALFERLWWHDQVVFDGSRRPPLWEILKGLSHGERQPRGAVQVHQHADANVAPGPPPFPDMVWIPGGTFLMGSDKHYPEERPAHRVTVDGFWIDRVPVTNQRFGASSNARDT